MRKGISILHILTFIIILLLVGLGYVFNLAFRDVKTFEKGIRESTVIEGVNTMELLRKNLEQALTYSYYQASFEVAKNGGYDKPNLPTWRNYNDFSGFPTNFEKTLADRTLKILNQYRTVLADTGMTTVDYTQVTAVKNKCIPEVGSFACEQLNKDESTCIAQTNCKWIEKSDKEYISALSKDNENKDQEIKVSKSAFYEVFNKANVFVLLPTKTLELFRIGKENFVTPNDKIKGKIIEGITASNFKSNYNQNSQTSTGSMRKCGVFPSADEVFIRENGFGFSTGKGRIIQNVDSKLSSLESELSSSTISTKLLNREIHSDIIPACTQNTEECCLQTDDGCVAYWQRTTCTFSYLGSSKATVKITDESTKYPVYDSTVDMRNIQLNFNVVSGNDYSRKLI